MFSGQICRSQWFAESGRDPAWSAFVAGRLKVLDESGIPVGVLDAAQVQHLEGAWPAVRRYRSGRCQAGRGMGGEGRFVCPKTTLNSSAVTLYDVGVLFGVVLMTTAIGLLAVVMAAVGLDGSRRADR